MTDAFAVGQRVWRYDINDRRGSGPVECVVEKVGRKLVTVKHVGYNITETYRIEDGQRNDNYGHSHIKTDEQRHEKARTDAAMAVLREHRLLPQPGCRLTIAELEAIAAVLRP